MAISDSIADYLTGIRNAYSAGKKNVTVPSSKIKVRMSEILKEEGFIRDFSVVQKGSQKYLHLVLRYLKGNRPAVKDLQRVSSPGLRVYSNCDKVPRVRSGMGMVLVSTSKGMMTDAKARKQGIGGELVCKVW